MSELWQSTLLYRIGRKYVDSITRLSFSSVNIVGRENIPTDGSVIFAANHTNTLMDPLVQLLVIKGPIAFGARADVFNKPKVAKILHELKVVPIARMEKDGADAASRNMDTFEIIADCLAHGTPFGIFPEGRHRPMHSLLPVKKGVFRIAELTIKMRPQGLYRSRRRRLRKLLSLRQRAENQLWRAHRGEFLPQQIRVRRTVPARHQHGSLRKDVEAHPLLPRRRELRKSLPQVPETSPHTPPRPAQVLPKNFGGSDSAGVPAFRATRMDGATARRTACTQTQGQGLVQHHPLRDNSRHTPLPAASQRHSGGIPAARSARAAYCAVDIRGCPRILSCTKLL